MLDVAVGYPIVKLVHLSLVLTSGALSTLYGAKVKLGQKDGRYSLKVLEPV